MRGIILLFFIITLCFFMTLFIVSCSKYHSKSKPKEYIEMKNERFEIEEDVYKVEEPNIYRIRFIKFTM